MNGQEQTTLLFIDERIERTLLEKFGLRFLDETGRLFAESATLGACEVDANQRAELIAYLRETETLFIEANADALERNLVDGRDLSPGDRRMVAYRVNRFIQTAGTSLGRSTFYNTRAEQAAAEEIVHENVFALDRGVYGLLLALPGITDHSRMLGVGKLLGLPRDLTPSLLTANEEKTLVKRLIDDLSVPRRLNLFARLRRERVNNARTRKLMLSSMLEDEALPFRSVKYRRKMRGALEHALGKRRAGILRAILSKDEAVRTAQENALVDAALGRFYRTTGRERLLECVGFLLGVETGLTLPELAAFAAAKVDAERLKELPFEVALGIAGVYHPGTAVARKERLLEATKDRLTDGQRLALQKTAREAGVQVKTDFTRYDATRLYLYAFAEGLRGEIRAALLERAARTARTFPARFKDAALIIDASASMAGGEDQPLRPLAVALAIRDALRMTADRCIEFTAGGSYEADGLIRPRGDTNLAEALLNALLAEAEVVFVVTDGYENAPAGRVAEVLALARRIGCRTPVYQVTPVFAAEAGGVRRLMPGEIPVLSVQSGEGLGAAYLSGLLWNDPVAALEELARRTLALPDERESERGETGERKRPAKQGRVGWQNQPVGQTNLKGGDPG